MPTGHFLFWSFGTKPLSITVFDIFNGECDADSVVDMTFSDLYAKANSTSFILVPINSSYATSYRLSVVMFDLGRTVYPQYVRSIHIRHRQRTDNRETYATL